MTAAGQSYSLRAKNRQWRIEIPEFNYREGGPKSQYFQFGYYLPLERRWQSYQRHRSLPPCTLRDAVDIQRESDYIQLKHNQDKCKTLITRVIFNCFLHYFISESPFSTSIEKLSGQVPSVRWNSHKRIPQDPCVVHHFARCYNPSRVYPCSYFEASLVKHSIPSIVVSADHRIPTAVTQASLSVMAYCPNHT
ncbi:unnamed protein product [Taenia asiatica]|uniref:Uncharacterized protein n=1 Tax=Taenia asiatica TaxID=60517 RepID=A0A0R3W8U6_TAEAS|nr:unnamed protein product [Taenia asiatica]